MNSDFIIHDLVNMFTEDTESIFDTWDILIAQGRENPPAPFAGIKDIVPVKRGFAYRKDTKSLQMSGKNSRLGSKDLAKGGLSPETVAKMEATAAPKEENIGIKTKFKHRLTHDPTIINFALCFLLPLGV